MRFESGRSGWRPTATVENGLARVVTWAGINRLDGDDDLSGSGYILLAGLLLGVRFHRDKNIFAVFYRDEKVAMANTSGRMSHRNFITCNENCVL